jgi:hypothetical protein
MTRLLSVGPESTSDDERVIAKGYTNYAPHIGALILVALVHNFGSTKELIGAGLIVIVFIGLFIEGRLHDLCIRLRRTNILLAQNTTRRPR